METLEMKTTVAILEREKAWNKAAKLNQGYCGNKSVAQLLDSVNRIGCGGGI